jgi:Flp pilus assembly pilin Flp
MCHVFGMMGANTGAQHRLGASNRGEKTNHNREGVKEPTEKQRHNKSVMRNCSRQFNGEEFEMTKLWNFVKGEEGLESAEYAVLGALIIIAIIAGVTLLGTQIGATFNNVAAVLPGA